MPSKDSAQAHLKQLIDLYEKKIAEGTINASEVSQYRALLKDRGWDREEITPATFVPPPVDAGEDEDDRVIKFG